LTLPADAVALHRAEDLDDDHADCRSMDTVRERLGFVWLGAVGYLGSGCAAGTSSKRARVRCCRRACRWRQAVVTDAVEAFGRRGSGICG